MLKFSSMVPIDNSDFRAILQDLIRHTVCRSLEIGHVVELIRGHEYDSFEITTNTHNRYTKNPNSNGDQWGEKSSTVASDNREYFGGAF